MRIVCDRDEDSLSFIRTSLVVEGDVTGVKRLEGTIRFGLPHLALLLLS